MRRSVVVVSALIAVVILAGSCASKRLGAKDDLNVDLDSPALFVPLEVRELKVVEADGHRGVLFKISRIPDAVAHRTESDPARIIIELKGPTGEESVLEEVPGGDSLVSRIQLAREFGVLRIVLSLHGDEVPRYSVHTMADWIMVRIPRG